MTRPPLFFAIPRGTPVSACRSCDQAIYWIVTTGGRRSPMSIAGAGCQAPTARDAGTGISHFVDCPNRDLHRKPKR